MIKSVFISRNLGTNSSFKTTLEASGFSVDGMSLVDFSVAPFHFVPKTDWIFFCSKKGVDFFLKYLTNSKTQIDFSCVKVGTMGEGTANILQKQKITPHFIGSGNPDTTASQFLEQARGNTVLFLRALNSKQSIERKLIHQIKCYSLVVYINIPKTDCRMLSQQLLVFTSPLNVEAYFNKHRAKPHQKIVAIGETTAAALRRFGMNELAISSHPTERALASKVLEVAV